MEKLKGRLETLIEQNKKMDDLIKRLNNKEPETMYEIILTFNELIEISPDLIELALKEYPQMRMIKAIIDMTKLKAEFKGISFKDELKSTLDKIEGEEKSKEVKVDETQTIKEEPKEPIPLEEKIAKLPNGCKFLISYVYDNNVFDRCFMSIKPNRDGEICIYPDTILKLEKDLELEKGYKNVKVINLVELD